VRGARIRAGDGTLPAMVPPHRYSPSAPRDILASAAPRSEEGTIRAPGALTSSGAMYIGVPATSPAW